LILYNIFLLKLKKQNLLEKPKTAEIVKANCLCMLQSKVKKLVELMKQSQIEDPDIVEDIDFLEKKLESLMIDVSSFDEYTLEITTNRLSWSPVHKSDKFWRENAQRLNENNFFLIRYFSSQKLILNFILLLL
jgi:V-type H+-transporting ATPase subunit H